MTDSLSSRFNRQVTKIKQSSIRLFDEEISSIDGLIKLTLGEPDFATPEHVKQAGIEAIENNQTSYFPSPGTLKLRRAASDFMEEHYGFKYKPESEIIVTVGATEALFASLQTVVNPGDKVIVPSPFFGLYASMITLLGGEPVYIDTSKSNFILSPEMLEAAFDEHGSSIKAILLNYPSNPTGALWTKEEAKAVADVLAKHPVFVISDEVYSEIVYEGEHVSIASYLPDQTILINGLSKSHAMTGRRLGLVYAPEWIMKHLSTAHQQLVTVASSISQEAAYEALENGKDDALPMVEAYRERRDYVYQEMTDLGFTVHKPNGAFYIFAKIPDDLEQDSYKFGLELAENAKVGIIPGSGFGPGGEGHIRLSYAASMENLQEAMRRIRTYLDEIRN